MDEQREGLPPDPESHPAPASYLEFLERWETAAGASAARESRAGRTPGPDAGAEPGHPARSRKKAASTPGRRRAPRAQETTGSDPLAPFLAARRRAATELIKVRLSPEQLYWLRLTATRAGRKVSESTIVAAGLRLIEWLGLDWRCIDSRAALAAALSEAMGTARPRPTDQAAAEREWEVIQRRVAGSASRPVADAGETRPAAPRASDSALPVPPAPVAVGPPPDPRADPDPGTGGSES